MKDLSKLYDYLLDLDKSNKNQQGLLINFLKQAGIFKDIQNDQDEKFFKIEAVTDTQNEAKQEEESVKSRKDIEKECLAEMWKVLSYEQREISKEILVELIHAMLCFDETQAINMKILNIQKVAKIEKLEETTIITIRKMIWLFEKLSKESKVTRHIHHFVTEIKPALDLTKEKEAKECSFVPNINPKSKKILISKHLSPKNEKKRSLSPKRYNDLYEEYKELKEKKLKCENDYNEEITKKYPFKPKVTKKAEKIQEDQNTRACLFEILI